MKMFLVLAVAVLSMSAFASKSMVTLSGYETGDQTDRSLNFSNSTGGSDNSAEQNIALNYAYAITDHFQIGAAYNSHKATEGGNIAAAGDRSTEMGLQVIYNFAGQLADTNYLALGYSTANSANSGAEYDDGTGTGGTVNVDDAFKVNTWALTFGHRFSLGNLWGMNFNYSPSAELAIAKTIPSDSDVADESSTTAVTLNFVKFDVLF